MKQRNEKQSQQDVIMSTLQKRNTGTKTPVAGTWESVTAHHRGWPGGYSTYVASRRSNTRWLLELMGCGSASTGQDGLTVYAAS